MYRSFTSKKHKDFLAIKRPSEDGFETVYHFLNGKGAKVFQNNRSVGHLDDLFEVHLITWSESYSDNDSEYYNLGGGFTDTEVEDILSRIRYSAFFAGDEKANKMSDDMFTGSISV